MKIAVTTDHAGFNALQELKVYINSLGHECIDFGPKSFNADDDYPDFIYPAALAVANGVCQKGIILGGSGQGEAIVANKVNGIRCALFYGLAVARESIDSDGTISQDPYEIVKLSRQHNDSNILSLSGRFLSVDEMMQAIKIWLDTPFSDLERHQRRIAKIAKLSS
jgi:ribose 5-phosphate isomerase B